MTNYHHLNKAEQIQYKERKAAALHRKKMDHETSGSVMSKMIQDMEDVTNRKEHLRGSDHEK